MPDVQHNTLSGSELHEPKGIDSASAGEVYVADGSSGGAWSPRIEILTGVIADVSIAETVYVPIPYSGNVAKIMTVIEGSIATSDATITVKDNAGNTIGTLTITQSGSAAGDVDSNTTLSNTLVTDDDYITVETDGSSTNNVKAQFAIIVERND